MSVSSRLTIVLLTYNCAQRVSSIISHLVPIGVPIVAVDNGSSDGTPEALAEYPQIEVIALQQNIGAAGRNVGAEHAATPYVAFCDDDGWYEAGGLELACDLLDEHPTLGLVNARIIVEPHHVLDPISAEMASSPLEDASGLPGAVLVSFMGGAAVVRRAAFLDAGGYDPRFFMGGEEETVALPLLKRGWELRYIPEVVMHHQPSLANASRFRAHGMRNTIVNAWLHRPLRSALRWTIFTLADTPKSADYLRGIAMSVASIPWILRGRDPMSKQLDEQLQVLDARRIAARRPFLSFRSWRPEDAPEWLAGPPQ